MSLPLLWVLGVGGSGPRIPDLGTKRHKSHIKNGPPDSVHALCFWWLSYFLKSFANACRASVGAPDEVWRSTTVRGAKSSHVLRAFLFTMRAGIVLLHWNVALGSKYVHWRHECSSARQFGHVLSNVMLGGALAPHDEHFTASPNAIIFGERGPSRSSGLDCFAPCGCFRCGSRSLSM